jgi:hypothetical protein
MLRGATGADDSNPLVRQFCKTHQKQPWTRMADDDFAALLVRVIWVRKDPSQRISED